MDFESIEPSLGLCPLNGRQLASQHYNHECMQNQTGSGWGGGPSGQGAHPVQLLLRPRTLGIELGLNQAGLRGILIRSARVIKNPTMQCLTVVSYGATGGRLRIGDTVICLPPVARYSTKLFGS